MNNSEKKQINGAAPGKLPDSPSRFESSSTGKDAPPRVAYIVSRFPKLTETFVLYEILEMGRLNVPVDIYPLIKGTESVVQAEAAELALRARYQSFFSISMLAAQWHFISRKPVKYFSALASALRWTFGSANFFFGAIGTFPKAVCFARDMERRKISHVHAQFANHAAVAAYIIRRLVDIPYSFTARGSDIHVERRMLPQKLDEAAFAIAVSSYNKQVMIDESEPRVAEKIHIVFGGVDTNRLSPEIVAPNDIFTILCVGRFEEVKGHAPLVEACRLLRDQEIEFECHLVGDGPLRPKIARQIADARLQDRFELHGALPYTGVLAQLGRATVVVLPTVPSSTGKREGIPNVLKEAMACGLPVVGSDIAGIPELVSHERTGLLVPPGDSVALADALKRLHDHKGLRKSLGEAARQHVVEHFNLRKSTALRAQLFLQHQARGASAR